MPGCADALMALSVSYSLYSAPNWPKERHLSVIIDIGKVPDLHIDTIVEAPCPEIYLGPRRRRDPGPPTTASLSKALLEWQASGAGNIGD